jgi:hypothetical protein
MSGTTELLDRDPTGMREHRNPDDRTAFAGRRMRRLDRARIADARPVALATVFGNNGCGRGRGAR